jgi:hypothetical protein
VNPDTDPNYENRLNVKIEELMKKGGDYYPLDTSNLAEFLETMDLKQVEYLSEHLINKRYESAGLYIDTIAYYHWQRLARIEAEARLAEEYTSCERCGGNGCPDCNDKENEGE